MKRDRPDERAVATAAHRAFAHGPFSAKSFATPDISADWIGKWGRGDKQPRIWELRELLPELLRADPVAAVVFVDEALGLSANGLILAPAPSVDGVPANLLKEAAEAGAAVGAVQAAVLEADRDGQVSAEESQRIRTLARAAGRELVHVSTVAARAEVHHQLDMVCA